MAPVVVGLIGLFLTNSTYGLYAYVLHRIGLFTNADILGSTGTALPAVMRAGGNCACGGRAAARRTARRFVNLFKHKDGRND